MLVRRPFRAWRVALGLRAALAVMIPLVGAHPGWSQGP